MDSETFPNIFVFDEFFQLLKLLLNEDHSDVFGVRDVHVLSLQGGTSELQDILQEVVQHYRLLSELEALVVVSLQILDNLKYFILPSFVHYVDQLLLGPDLDLSLFQRI